MKNSKLFEPELDLNSEESQLYKVGIKDVNAKEIHPMGKVYKISPLFLKCKNIFTLMLNYQPITKIENIPDGLKYLYLYDAPVKQITRQAYDTLKDNYTTVAGVNIDKLEIVE